MVAILILGILVGCIIIRYRMDCKKDVKEDAKLATT